MEKYYPSVTVRPGSVARERIHGWRKFFVDWYYIWLEQMLEIRSLWHFYAVFAVAMPVSMVFGFGRMGGEASTPEHLSYITTGAAVFSITNEAIVGLAQRIGVMRQRGALLYYATLPISNSAFICAILCARMVIALPGMLLAFVASSWLYDLHLWTPWLWVILPLTALSLANIGMAMGAVLRNPDIIAGVTNLLLLVILLGAPVFIPQESLPVPLQILGYMLPPTYAADALRRALEGGGIALYGDLVVLTLFSIAGFSMTKRWLRW